MKNVDFISHVIGQIYDSAIEPGAWVEAFQSLRDEMRFAYVGMNATEFPVAAPPSNFLDVGTEWDRAWLAQLLGNLQRLPVFETLRQGEIDQPMVFRQLIPDDEFRRTEFYRNWVLPQGLDDAVNTIVLKRQDMVAVLTVWTREGRRRISERDTRVLRLIGPHLRRSLLISGLLDRARSQGLVGSALLDKLAAAVFLIGEGGAVLYANASGEAMLADGRHLRLADRRLRAASRAQDQALDEALRRGLSDDDSEMGTWGCATVLHGPQGDADIDVAQPGDAALVYVLPMGRSEVRHSLGAGQCAVFVVPPGAAVPPPIEVIASVLGLTSAEAACAITVAQGLGTDTAAERLGIARNTFRKHLSNIFDKTGLADRVALSAAINRLRVPLLPGG